MKKLLLLLFLLPCTVMAQSVNWKYWRPVTINTTDTIPSPTTWWDIENVDVFYALAAFDSNHVYVEFDVADSAFNPNNSGTATGLAVPHLVLARAVGEDSLANFANAANPRKSIFNVLRSGTTDKLKGMRFVRARIIAPNVAAKLAAAAGDRVIRFNLVLKEKR